MSSHQLDIPASQWLRRDISAVRDLLTQVGADPALSRMWRASLVLTFADLPPKSYPYLEPAIAEYLKIVYDEFPHFLYFLSPDPTRGATDSFFATLGVLCETPAGYWVIWDDDVAKAFYHALAKAAEFAIAQGDDWVTMVEGYEWDERQTRYAEVRAILVDRGVLED